MVLRCDANKMTALNTCRGPKACAIVPHPAENKVEFVCDDSLAMPGDACDTNGEQSCSMDKKSMYVCTANKFARPKALQRTDRLHLRREVRPLRVRSGDAAAHRMHGGGGQPQEGDGKKR